jgi:hypothetical protein
MGHPCYSVRGRVVKYITGREVRLRGVGACSGFRTRAFSPRRHGENIKTVLPPFRAKRARKNGAPGNLRKLLVLSCRGLAIGFAAGINGGLQRIFPGGSGGKTSKDPAAVSSFQCRSRRPSAAKARKQDEHSMEHESSCRKTVRGRAERDYSTRLVVGLRLPALVPDSEQERSPRRGPRHAEEEVQFQITTLITMLRVKCHRQ